MPIKHQSQCYRVIGGEKYTNLCDLIMSEEENTLAFESAKKTYTLVRQIKHPDGYYQLFAAKPKLFLAKLIDVGRSQINKDFYFNKTTELHKELQKHLASRHWGLEEMEEGTDKYEITSGLRVAGTVIVTEVKAIEQ